jgi:hypothetical protein
MGLDHSHQSVKTLMVIVTNSTSYPATGPANRESIDKLMIQTQGKTATSTRLYSNIRHVFKVFPKLSKK